MLSRLSSLGHTLHLFHQLQGCPQGLNLHLFFQVHPTELFHSTLLGLIGGANWELLGWIPSCRVRGSSVEPE